MQQLTESRNSLPFHLQVISRSCAFGAISAQCLEQAALHVQGFMPAASGILTCIRTISRLIGSEVAGTSGSQYLERTVSLAPWSTSASFKSYGGGSVPAGLLQTFNKQCMHSHAGSYATARQLVLNTRNSPLVSFNLRSLLLNTNTHTIRQQHNFRTQASVKSLWQRDYYNSGFGYRRSYSIWDGDNVLYGLIAANLAGFLLWQSYPGLMYRHATVSVNSVREGRVYTLLTSAFSHNAFSHILANMFTLYFFGRSMSHVLGGKKVCPTPIALLLKHAPVLILHPVYLLCFYTAAATVVSGWRSGWQFGSCDTVLHTSTVHR